jgi:adenosylhomocysteine nucleosidase
LKPLVRGWRRESRNGVELWRRTRGDDVWIAACAGAGVDAAMRALSEIDKEGAIDLFVSTGWAGALREELETGRAYRVSGVVDARTGERFGVAGASGVCWLVTSGRIADRVEKRRLAAAYGAGFVDMEAAEVARQARMRGIPFCCVKGVSDGFSDHLPEFNGFISAKGQFQWVRFILFAMLRPWHWPALLRLGKNSRKAAKGIRETVLEILDERGIVRKP